ncbi:MAG: 2-oxoglutarate ferredoxin oxidoreductase subunit alpha, partial [Bacteroidota bacterium]
IRPFPKNLGEFMKNYDQVLIPEMNKGQLIKMIREKYLVPAIGFSKVQGLPFSAEEILSRIVEMSK